MNDASIFVLIRGAVRGPYSLREVLDMHRKGEILEDSDVCEGGSDRQWVKLRELFPEYFERPKMMSSSAVWAFVVSALAIICLCLGILAWSTHEKLEKANVAWSDNAKELESLSQEVNDAKSLVKGHELDYNRKLAVAGKQSTSLLEQSEKYASELTKVRQDLEKEKQARRRYIERFIKVAEYLQDAAVTPQKVKIEVLVNNDAPLFFDQELILASIDGEMAKREIVVVEDMEAKGPTLQIVASVGQLTINDDINSAFTMEFQCVAPDLLTGGKRKVVVHGARELAFAGKSSTYRSMVKEFFEAESAKAAATIAKLGEETAKIQAIATAKEDLAKLTDGERAPSAGVLSPSAKSTGSGYVIGSRPLIVTNAHVVDKGQRIRVHFSSLGAVKEAVVLHSDVENDIAVLALKEQYKGYSSKTFPAFASKNEVKIGSEVFSLV